MTYTTGADMIEDAKRRVKQVTAQEVLDRQRRGEQSLLLDCREDREWNLGHLPGALHIARGTLEGKVEGLIPRDRPVVVYCARGNRSALAADTMQRMGYTDVASLVGGIGAWVSAGGEVEG